MYVKRQVLVTEEIDWFVPHQANLRIINALGRKLGLPSERVVVTVRQACQYLCS
ncbi:hypothetical protein OURE66S_01490 [Oligella ureolytica]